jgi:hypothetical protein
MTTRRAFLESTAVGAGLVLASGHWQLALAANDRPLIDSVAAACNRLAPLGWRQMMLDVTGGELDITAPDLHAQLVKKLAHIDRAYPGFGDFDAAGTRGIEAGVPDRSLLYHAFASPTVVANRTGTELGGFPTLAEIDAVENYVYGVVPPTMAALRKRAGKRKLAVVVYALQYRNTPNSVHGQHAELCFARSGIARLGTIGPLYDAKARNFVPLDPTKPFDFRAMPQRFAAYLAIQMRGNEEKFGPQDALEGDDRLSFWVPIHKLFGGTECIAGMDLNFGLGRDLRNDELAQFHRYMDLEGYQNNWRGPALEQFPFTIRNEKIASFSARAEYGPGILEPAPAPLATAAQYQGKPLTFPVDPDYMSDPANLEFSSMQVLPGRPTRTPGYMYDTSQGTQRPAPEYLNVRHKVLADGQIDNLNKRPKMMAIIKAGDYQTQHYIDFTGDGWIEAQCPALAPLVDGFVAAYVMVAPPDFFPSQPARPDAVVEERRAEEGARRAVGGPALRAVADPRRREHQPSDRLQRQRQHRHRHRLAARCERRTRPAAQRARAGAAERHARRVSRSVRSGLGHERRCLFLRWRTEDAAIPRGLCAGIAVRRGRQAVRCAGCLLARRVARRHANLPARQIPKRHHLSLADDFSADR